MTHNLARLVTVALFCTPLACASGNEGTSTVPPPPAATGANTVPRATGINLSTDAFELRVDVRAGYIDEAHWTRNYIVASLARTNDVDAAEARLTEAEVATAETFERFLGKAKTADLSQLLVAHVTGLRAVLAAQQQDVATKRIARAVWFANADQIARVLADANPSWAFADLQSGLHQILTATLAQIDARAASQWPADILAWNTMRDNEQTFADTISNGLEAGYPKMVGSTRVPVGEQTLRLALQTPLEDTALWTRQVIASHTAQLADESFAVERLGQTTSALTAVLAPAFGEASTARIVAAMQVVIADSLAYLDETDASARNPIRGNWFADAQEVANAFSEASSMLSLAALGKQMGIRVATTAAEIDAFTTNDYATEVGRFDVAVMSERGLAQVVAVVGSRSTIIVH